MPTETIIRTLKESKEDNPKHILPRTVLKAVADESGNFISSDVTAQDINNLHEKTFVTAEQQTLTNAQKEQARNNIDAYTKPTTGIPATDLDDDVNASLDRANSAALPDGYYGDSGGVFQYSTNFLGKNTPQNVSNVVFRPTASNYSGSGWSSDSISGQTATIEKIKGKTLVFNQLISGSILSTTFDEDNGHISKNGNKIIIKTDNPTSSANYIRLVEAYSDSETSWFNNKKVLFMIRTKNGGSSSTYQFRWSSAGPLGVESYSLGSTGAKIIVQSTVANRGIWLIYGAGVAIDEELEVNIINLTQMYGAGNEPATVEEFKAQFPLDYYQFSQGELISLNAIGLKTTGFNQLYPDGHIDVLAGLTYKIEGTYTSLKDSAGNDVTVANGEFTPTANDTYTMVGGTCVHLKWSGVRDGETEEHWDSELSLPIATYFADGMKSAGTVYDELIKGKAIQRIGSRAYQSGDEEDNTVVTDMTTTYYPIETPVETPVSPELNLTYRCDDFGTEMLLPQNTDEPITAPMDADIVYQLDYEADVRNMDLNMISKSSMDNFISAFNASGLGTITQTWDATNKKYNYTVTAPQPTEGGETV